jgi:hypothetical protein
MIFVIIIIYNMIYHWLRIITRLSGYVIEKLNTKSKSMFYNVSGEFGYDSKPVISDLA